jgi:hypothetical protein
MWPFIFEGTPEPSLEKYYGNRTHPGTGKEIADYVIIDVEPVYKDHNKKDTFLCHYFAGIIRGVLCYAGFDCDVKIFDEPKPNGKNKVEYVVEFNMEVLDREGN